MYKRSNPGSNQTDSTTSKKKHRVIRSPLMQSLDNPDIEGIYELDTFQSYAAKHGFRFIDTEGFRGVFFAPVATTGNMTLGTFAKEFIPKDTCLTSYHGKAVKYPKTDNSVSNNNSDYFFIVESNEEFEFGIDAFEERNWAAMVNGTSEMLANIEAKREEDTIVFYASKDIYVGQQLLLCYGDRYRCDNFRYLSPRDNWLALNEHMETYDGYYSFEQTEVFTLSHHALMGLLTQTEYFRLSPNAVLDIETVDLPLITLNDEKIIELDESENLSTLMLYTWQGDTEKVAHYLLAGANPNLQSSIKGFTPLHFLMCGEHITWLERVTLFEQLLRHNAALTVTCAKNLTPLAYFVECEIIALEEKIQFIQALIPKGDEFSEVLNAIYFHAINAKHLTSLEKKRIKDTIVSAHMIDEQQNHLYLKAIKAGDLHTLQACINFMFAAELDYYITHEDGMGKHQIAIESLISNEEIFSRIKCKILSTIEAFYSKSPGCDILLKLVQNLIETNFPEDQSHESDVVSHASLITTIRTREKGLLANTTAVSGSDDSTTPEIRRP